MGDCGFTLFCQILSFFAVSFQGQLTSQMAYLSARFVQSFRRISMQDIRGLSRSEFLSLVSLLGGTATVQRIGACHRWRRIFGSYSLFSLTRACPWCLFSFGCVHLDSEWHWLFQCVQFSTFRQRCRVVSHFSEEVRATMSADDLVALLCAELRHTDRSRIRSILRLFSVISRHRRHWLEAELGGTVLFGTGPLRPTAVDASLPASSSLSLDAWARARFLGSPLSIGQ